MAEPTWTVAENAVLSALAPGHFSLSFGGIAACAGDVVQRPALRRALLGLMKRGLIERAIPRQQFAESFTVEQGTFQLTAAGKVAAAGLSDG